MGGGVEVHIRRSITHVQDATHRTQGERCDNDCGGGDSVKPVYVQNGRRRRRRHAVEKEARRIQERDTFTDLRRGK